MFLNTLSRFETVSEISSRLYRGGGVAEKKIFQFSLRAVFRPPNLKTRIFHIQQN